MRCLKTRWAISRAADEGGPLPERARQHIDGCRDCEAFERRTEWLGRTLERARDQAPPAPATVRLPRHLTVAGVLAAGAVAVVLIAGNGEAPEPGEKTVVAERDRAPEPDTEPAPTGNIDINTLAADAEVGIRYVLRVSGLPEPN